jgi:mgtE-like transporter
MTVREVAASAYREALPALAASVVGGLFAGAVLGGMRAELGDVSGLLVLVPALLATRGNVYGSLGARLATGLHQGLLEPKIDLDDDRLRGAIAAALANGVLVSMLAAVATYAALTALGANPAPLLALVSIALLAGVMSGIALTVAVVSVVIVGFRRGLDPDTFVGPVVTTTGDFVGLAVLLLATRIVAALLGGI